MKTVYIPLDEISIPEFTSTMPISGSDLIRCGWSACGISAVTKMAVVCGTTPSDEHPGFVHYEVLNCAGMSVKSRRPTTPAFAGSAIDHELSPLGMTCGGMRWREVGVPPAAPAAGPFNEIVYVLRAGPFIKIGKATGTPTSRISDLQTGCPYRIELVGYFAGGVKEEIELHRKFAAHRSSGEWFNCVGEVADFAAGVGAGL